MATKQLGCGTLVKVDHDSDAVFTTIALVSEMTPPSQAYAVTDASELSSCIAQEEGHREEPSEFQFVQHWHPGDSNHQIIDDLFALGSAAGKRNWQNIYPFDTPVTEQFEGWVQAMTPSTVTPQETIKRTVTVKRSGPITRT